jgi:hypothetical protein
LIGFPEEPRGKLCSLVLDPLTSVVTRVKTTPNFAILVEVARVEIPLGGFDYVSNNSHGSRPDTSPLGIHLHPFTKIEYKYY